MCADAEWEKRGKSNTEIRLQDVHNDKGHDCDDALVLDPPGPVTVTANSVITTTGFTNVATSTVTAVVFTTPQASPTATTVFPSMMEVVVQDDEDEDTIPHKDL